MAKLKLTRDQLAKFLPDHQTIRAFEQLFDDVDVTIPDASDEANNNAGIALAVANAALAEVANIISQLQLALSAPVSQPPIFPDDLAPRMEIGTIASQNADSVSITGGSIDGVTFGATVPGSATFTSISYSGQLTSTVATGTAPFVVASTTKVANLNADLLDGGDWAAPGSIGSVTPATGAFTTLTASAAVNLNPANASVTISPTGTGTLTFAPAAVGHIDNVILGGTTPAAATVSTLQANSASTLIGNVTIGNGASVGEFIKGANSGVAGGAFLLLQNGGTNVIGMGNKSAINGGAYDATPYVTAASQIEFQQGIKVPGGGQLIQTSTALTNGAGAGAGTITNAPAAGNPTKWIGINDNGTTRYIPAW